MASDKQIAANGANAKQSTGPTSASGKARSRRNAWKHGLTAQAITIAGEDPKEFEILQAQLSEEWEPLPGTESILVDRLAGQAWRIHRIPAFEAALIEARRAEVEHDPGLSALRSMHRGRDIGLALALIWDGQRGDMFGKLARHEAALLNAFHRTLQQLLALQDRRRREEERNLTGGTILLPTSDRDAA